jgi:alcohol dehydrogenase (cytochrome c)
VTTTAGGLVLTGESTGDLVALDPADGRVLNRFNTGGAMTAGIVTYSVAGEQYVAAATGKGSFWFGGPGAPTVVVFGLPAESR